VPDRGEPLFDARRGELARPGLDPRRNVHRLDAPIDGTPTFAHQDRNSSAARGIGAARVRVADVGREELEEAHARTVASGGDKLGESGLGYWGEPVHWLTIKSRN
jgi:hypothetical protein